MSKAKLTILMSLAGMLASLLLPSSSMAIPAWARRYGTNCTLCHYPNTPRLNSYGHRFRRAGYRTEGEMNNAQDIAKVGNFLSVRGRVRYTAGFPDHMNTTNDFRLNDITIFYGGALSKHFSAFTETEVDQNGEVDVLATAHGIMGEWGNFATIRVGQMHTLTRVGFGGLDRPTGISTAAPLSQALTKGGVPFKLGEDEKGLELTYVLKDSRVIAQVLNGVNMRGGIADGRAGSDDDQDKDYVVAFEQIVDDIASGFTVFGYRGVAHFDSTGNVAKGKDNRFTFYRMGITANKVVDLSEIAPLCLELQGGFVRSQDDVPVARGANVSGNAFFVQGEEHFKDLGFTLFQRYDFINPRLGYSGDRTIMGTVGVAAPVEDIVRVALEGNLKYYNDEGDATKRRGAYRGRDLVDYGLTAEVMFNF